MDFIKNGFVFLRPYPYLQAALVIIAFLFLAKLADWFFSRVARRITASPRNNFDERLIDLVHRPVFATVALVGLILAAYRVDLDPNMEDNTIDAIKTIIIVIWVIFGLRFSRLLFDALGRAPAKKSLVQPATRPLFTNALSVFIVIAGAYAILDIRIS